MKLTIELPLGCDQERFWIVDTLLGEFLGLDYVIKRTEFDEVRIMHDTKTLRLPDTFFANARDWGHPSTCRMERTDFTGEPIVD